jgi:hypothetical protein
VFAKISSPAALPLNPCRLKSSTGRRVPDARLIELDYENLSSSCKHLSTNYLPLSGLYFIRCVRFVTLHHHNDPSNFEKGNCNIPRKVFRYVGVSRRIVQLFLQSICIGPVIPGRASKQCMCRIR